MGELWGTEVANLLWGILNTMQTIQVVLDDDLLQAVDRVARRIKINRSALLREALRDRQGYEKRPDSGELTVWEGVAAWPEE